MHSIITHYAHWQRWATSMPLHMEPEISSTMRANAFHSHAEVVTIQSHYKHTQWHISPGQNNSNHRRRIETDRLFSSARHLTEFNKISHVLEEASIQPPSECSDTGCSPHHITLGNSKPRYFVSEPVIIWWVIYCVLVILESIYCHGWKMS